MPPTALFYSIASVILRISRLTNTIQKHKFEKKNFQFYCFVFLALEETSNVLLPVSVIALLQFSGPGIDTY